MADLGAVVTRNAALTKATLIPITAYTVVRGNFLGTITRRDAALPHATLHGGLGPYIVRQLTVVFKQLWPDHGQRFPQ